MTRFFVDKDKIKDPHILIDGDNFQHMSRVLRMREGDSLTICDGEKTDYICTVSNISKKEAVCEILSAEENKNESAVSVTLFQGVPKGAKMDLIIQKCVELGAVKIVPFISKRTVATAKGKFDRFQKISLEAAKQSGRGIIPEVSEIVSFDDALSELKALELPIMAYEESHGFTLKDAIRGKSPKSVGILIGPEGGFDITETTAAEKAGVTIVSLGNRILRTETAGLSVISNIMYELEL